MSSKLLRDSSPEIRKFQYHEIAGSNMPAPKGREEHPSANSAPAAPSDNDRLLARVSELEAELQRQVAAARASGMREGETIGRNQGEAAVKPVIDRMCRSIQELAELKPRLRKELEEEAVRLALAISKRILRREVGVDAASIQGLVQVAFERIGRQEITKVLVHPDQIAAVKACLGQLTTREIQIVGDSSRERGTLIFEMTRGSLDASVDTQLREIELGLADRLKWR